MAAMVKDMYGAIGRVGRITRTIDSQCGTKINNLYEKGMLKGIKREVEVCFAKND